MLSSVFETNRVERSWTVLLDHNDQMIRTLQRTTSGKITQNVNAKIRGAGKITVVDDADIEWTKVRLQPWVEVAGYEPWPLGVFLPSAPSIDHNGEHTEVDVELHDKLLILDDDKVENTYVARAGQVVTTLVRQIIESAGEKTHNITASSEKVRSETTWDPGTTKLRIINDLLASINYFAIHADGYGVFRVVPYTAPAARPVIHEFRRGPRAIHLPTWNRDRDIAGVPNKVVLIGQGDEKNPPLRGVHTNTDPNSPFSYEQRGERWIVEVEEDVEASSQAVINDLAKRRLVSLSSPSATITIQHAMIPIDPNDVVRFDTVGADNVLATVEKFDVSLTPGSLMKGTWREVVDV